MISKPTPRAQPAEPIYAIENLQLFERFNRATYLQAFDVHPPPWDKRRRIKRWFDTTVGNADELVAYDIFDPTSPTGTRMMPITVEEARTPNLPGAAVYPKYVIAPTPAVIVDLFPDTPDQPYNPEHICRYSEAVALAAEFGLGPDAVSETTIIGAFGVNWKTETRRPWTITWRGDRHQASLLLRLKYGYGVGAPGNWDVSGSSPIWIPERVETGEQDTRPEIPMPVRRLLPGEKLKQGFGGIWMIHRGDLQPPSADDLLQRIDAQVASIARHLGI